MYTIAGVTGRVGSATAERLLDEGAPVPRHRPGPGEGATVGRRGADAGVVDSAPRRPHHGDRSSDTLHALPFDRPRPTSTTTPEHSCRRSRARFPTAVCPTWRCSGGGGRSVGGHRPIVGVLHDLEELSARPERWCRRFARALPREGLRRARRHPLRGRVPRLRRVGRRARANCARPGRRRRRGPGAAGPATAQRGDRPGWRPHRRRVAEILGHALSRRLEVVTIPSPGSGRHARRRRLLPPASPTPWSVYVANDAASSSRVDPHRWLRHRPRRRSPDCSAPLSDADRPDTTTERSVTPTTATFVGATRTSIAAILDGCRTHLRWSAAARATTAALPPARRRRRTSPA